MTRLLAVILASITFSFGAFAAKADETRPHVDIVAIGSSLTQGYNLPPGTDFCAVLEQRLRAEGYDVTIVNAGVSGDTSAGGLARLDWALAGPVDGVMIELGSNDMLRGIEPDATEANLEAILTRLKERGLPVHFSGMMAQRNLGPEYVAAFDGIYPRLALKYGAIFYPFWLDGIAADLSLNQADGIHPNEAGTQIVVDRMLPSVRQLVDAAIARRNQTSTQ